MLRFVLEPFTGVFEDSTVTLTGGAWARQFEELLQTSIDYHIAYHAGYVPGPDASAKEILLGMGAVITDESDAAEGMVY